jgi:peptide/nickel transport system permease protein
VSRRKGDLPGIPKLWKKEGDMVFRFIVRRILEAIPSFIGICILTFLLLHLVPGGPAQAAIGPHYSAAKVAALNRALGLNKPLYTQFWIWFTHLLEGNMGTSYVYNQPVLKVIGNALPHTLELVVVAIIVSHILAVIIGTIQGYYRNTWFDHAVTTISFFFWSMPLFWLGILMVMLFSVDLGWFPSGGISSPTAVNPGLGSYVAHTALPVATLVLSTVATWMRYMRSSMVDSMVQDYVRTARAKGVSELRVVFKHALRNSLLPLITLLGLSIPALFAGALVIEEIFNYPGMGLLFWTSAFARDYPVLLGITVVVGVLTILGNLLADILYSLVDPRIQYR